MDSDGGKLFIGGISWETSEERLREYFSKFGEVVEAMILKDRSTGRPRGFGFVIFADPAVAERVIMEKHLIDGRMVEAKKAVPKDDQHILIRNSSLIQSSPGPSRTKKIFVGGLASTVTDADFKKYFEQFGTITDVVVMYDHNTQRPRGFGFITFDSEDAVDHVLRKTFHELNGKMVEVKKAVPKELSPGPNLRLPLGGYGYGLNRVSSFLNEYGQGYNPNSIGSYGMRVDGRFGLFPGGRKGFPPFSPDYGIGMNFEPGMTPSYGGNSNFSSSIGYGQALSPYYSVNSSRFASPVGYGAGIGNPGSSFGSSGRSLWGNGSLNYNTSPASSNSYMASGNGNLGGFGNNSRSFGFSSSPFAAHGVGGGSDFTTGSLSYGTGENKYGLASSSYGRSSTGPLNTSFTAISNGHEGNYTDSYGGSSLYGGPTWQSVSSELDGCSPFGYGLGPVASEVTSKGSSGYLGSYSVQNRQINREG